MQNSMEITIGLIVNSFIFYYSLSTKKLSLDGAIAAFIIGEITITSSPKFYILLLLFFLTSSKATKLGKELKQRICSTYKKEKTRNVIQVLCNGGIPTLYALIFYLLNYTNSCISDSDSDSYTNKNLKIKLILMFLSYYAACNADTWASEIGVLSKRDPILITNFKTVPKGTNGGVSWLGTIMSILGGFLIGVAAALMELITCIGYNKTIPFFTLTLTGLVSGFIGSILDSFLGALLQETIYNKETKQVISKEELLLAEQKDYIKIGRDILSNNSVNIISATITSLIIGIVV